MEVKPPRQKIDVCYPIIRVNSAKETILRLIKNSRNIPHKYMHTRNHNVYMHSLRNCNARNVLEPSMYHLPSLIRLGIISKLVIILVNFTITSDLRDVL